MAMDLLSPPPSARASRVPPLLEPVAAAIRVPGGRVAVAGAVGCLGLLGLAFSTELRHFAYTWHHDDNYSHGFLVPLLSLYFANEAAKRGPIAVRSGVVLGVALLSLSMIGKLATILIPVGFVGGASFLLGLAGVVALIGGIDALVRFRFAIGFLVFMIPLPVDTYTSIASPLQLLVSRVASATLNALGIPVLCEGNTMTLPGGIRMFVAEACSGMRQMTGFLALTTAVAYLGSRPAWYRGVVVAASMPIALTANVVRVVLTGLIMYRIDPKLGTGGFHEAEGLVMMLFGLGLLGLFCAGLNAIVRAPSAPRAAPAALAGA